MSLLSQLLGKPPAQDERVTADASAPPGASRNIAHPLEGVLARQILEAHLRARHQAMEADPSRLDGLPLETVELLIRAMGAAAHADGAVDALERTRIERALGAVVDEARREALRSELADPPCLEALVRRAQDIDAAGRFYAVSVRTVRRGLATNRAYLAYLANRLGLPQDLVVRLDRRFDVPLYFR